MNNIIKKTVTLVTAAALVLTTVPVGSTAQAKAKKPKLNKSSLTLKVGESYKLKVKKITGYKIKWKSSNKKVATVSKKGKVKAKRRGKSKITAKVAGYRLTCRVNVKAKKKSVPARSTSPVPATSPAVSLSPLKTPLPNQNSGLSMTFSPENSGKPIETSSVQKTEAPAAKETAGAVVSMAPSAAPERTETPETTIPEESKSPVNTSEPLATAVPDGTISNPVIVKDNSMQAGQKVTYDCIYFGEYPQSEVTGNSDPTVYSKLTAAAESEWSSNGDITINGQKYRRLKRTDSTYGGYLYDSDDTGKDEIGVAADQIYYVWEDDSTYHYFKYEPIKWRVLSSDGTTALLLADKGLDDQKYNTNYTGVTWENSSIRSFLNGLSSSENEPGKDYTSKNFIDTAFSSSERNAIKNTDVKNQDENIRNTDVDAGNDTSDKVFLLSEKQTSGDDALKYGFASDYLTCDEARQAKSTDYAKAMGVWQSASEYAGNCWWWLRSPGDISNYFATSVYLDGDAANTDSVSYDNHACRPALNLNLSESSSSLWSYAGTVCTDGTVTE